jgi:type I restriction enzyme S subunit
MYDATIRKLGISSMDSATNQACCAINSNQKLSTKFLYYIFLATRKHLIGMAYGGGQPNMLSGNNTYITHPLKNKK